MRGWRNLLVVSTVVGSALAMATAGAGVADAQPAPEAVGGPGTSADINVFFNALSPYGVWERNSDWGWVWYPNSVPAGWRPYTHGRWVLTDDGWSWVSDWEWGWGPFHYGRWFDDPEMGWLWVPGAVWAPAWVMWEQSPDYIGWAPLPPQVGWSWSLGLQLGDFNLEAMLPPAAFVFVPDRDFIDRDLHRFIVPRYRSGIILPRAHVVTRYGISNGRIIDHGVPPEFLEHRYGYHIHRYDIRGVEAPPALHRGGRYAHGGVEFYRPHFREGEHFGPRTGELGIPPLPPPNHLFRQQERQNKQLERRHTYERRQLDHLQNRERRRPPNGMGPGELQRQHAQERRFMQRQHERENHQMQQRHLYERQRSQREQRARGAEHSGGGGHHDGRHHGRH